MTNSSETTKTVALLFVSSAMMIYFAHSRRRWLKRRRATFDENENNAEETKNEQGKDFGGGKLGGDKTMGDPINAFRRATLSRRRSRLESQQNTQEEVTKCKKRQDLLGKIEACYASMQLEPPFGLSSANSHTLRNHLSLIRKRQQAFRGNIPQESSDSSQSE